MVAKLGSAAWGIIANVLFVAVFLGILLLFGIDEQVLRLLKWIDAQGFWASLLFMLIMAMVVVLLLPGLLFTAGAGFVFGVVEGSIYVVIGTTFGAMLAFQLGTP